MGIGRAVIAEVQNFLASPAGVISTTIAAVTAPGAANTLLPLGPALFLLLALLAALFDHLFNSGTRFGEVINLVRICLLERSDPRERQAGLFIWQCFVHKVFSEEQGESDFEAISYAVMDGHDYFDRSCGVNVDSIEVFFDARDPMLIAFVDALLAFEIGQEVNESKAFAGYVSLRFMGRSHALLAEQRFEYTCAIEVAGLRDVVGVTELVSYAIGCALNPNFSGILHWGQRNPSNRDEIQARFGDTFASRSGNLHRWRKTLSRLTENGRLDGFSSQFSRRTGLEVVTPRNGTLNAARGSGTNQLMLTWDYSQNPPGTSISIRVTGPGGAGTSLAGLPLAGQQAITAGRRGAYMVVLTAGITLGGERREVTQQVSTRA